MRRDEIITYKRRHKEHKNKKDKIFLCIFKILDWLLGCILLLYFFVVLLTMVGLIALIIIILFN